MGTDIKVRDMPEIFNLAGNNVVECWCDEINNAKCMIEIALEEGALHGTRGLINEKPADVFEEIIEIQDSNNYIGKDYIKYLTVDLPVPAEYDNSGLTKEYKDNINKFIDGFLKLFENYSVVYMLPCGCSYIHFLINPVDFDGNILEFTDEYIQKIKYHMDGVITGLFPNTDKVYIHIYE